MRASTYAHGQQCSRKANLSETSVIDRLREGLAGAGLDCRCEDRANSVIAQIARIRREGALEDARKMRDAIAIVLVLLAELDELTVGEDDLSAFEEVTTLFDDIAEFAARGAAFGQILSAPSVRSEGDIIL